MRSWNWIALTALLTACGGQPKEQTLEQDAPADPTDQSGPATIQLVEYEKKTRELMDATQKLDGLRGDLDDQRRRLMVICADFPEHDVCAPQTEASYAQKAFCGEEEFTRHVDTIVASCHQGACKQVDQAEQISRSEYMLLTQRLPHSLVRFRLNETRVDKRDKRQMQGFLEAIGGEKGYVIIVGRASKDGSWKHNLKLALKRAENTRKYLVEQLGLDPERVGYITYGHDKMYLTALDAERLSTKKLTMKQANRSALIFAYPCYEGAGGGI
jgi:outer membrane protein OmpA-like peptidoglycan-associated protein